MGEVFAKENLENGCIAIVGNFRTTSDTYLNNVITGEENIAVFLELSGSLVLISVEDLFEGELSDIILPVQSDPVTCDHCGKVESRKAIEVTVFSSGLLDTVEQTSDDKRVVGMMSGEERYHCKECFEMFRDKLEYHVQNGPISDELTIRNI